MHGNALQYLGQIAKKSGFSSLWKKMINSGNVELNLSSQQKAQSLLKCNCSILPKHLEWLVQRAPVFPIHGSQVSY